MSPKYNTGVREADQEIEALAKKYSEPQTQELIRQILTSVVKLYFDKANEGDLKLINNSLKELRHAFRILAPYRNVRKVVMWGSSRVKPHDSAYKMAVEFAQKISKLGFMVITGGGGGIMEAGNRGAGDESFAANIMLPAIQKVNPYVVKGEKLLNFRYFFTRKLIFVKETDATVLFPGGLGTNDEAFEILTLFQTGKCMPRPIILVNAPQRTYWKTWLAFLEKEMLRRGFIYKDELKLFKVVNSVKGAIQEILNFYRVYHSIRYVGPLTILRLNKPLSEAAVRRLNQTFSDMLVEGKIQPCDPRPEEVEDQDYVELPRLAMKFNRRNYGRLCELIRQINTYSPR